MHNLIYATLCIAALFLLPGCAPLVVAAGAGAGYLVADQESRQKVDHFFQDLNKSIKKSTRRILGEQQTRKQIAHQPSAGFTLTIQQDTLTPTSVLPGERINLRVQYAIMGAPAAGIRISKQQTLFFAGKQVTVINKESTTRTNGTWENTLAFAVPKSAQPGTYTVKQEISAQGKTRSTQRTFTVR
ncbi:hypothetical protein [Desulfobulbus alkaliphilus]|uniref:hypothetical protein n=1 Tax=Desulfobulbus alkaliphilus TaxID=869814 RepID=UPI001965CA4C|nr:hypothetical protein [Desulfobulbus alkaliphilus]MBM9536616.1 hypothetical protein [Desulfobulbus alkaliphilus]